jgi:hypothetical protein
MPAEGVRSPPLTSLSNLSWISRMRSERERKRAQPVKTVVHGIDVIDDLLHISRTAFFEGVGLEL